MQVTELLVTGYDGDEPVLAINLESGAATVALIGSGGAVVDAAWNQSSQAFASICRLIEELAVESASMRS